MKRALLIATILAFVTAGRLWADGMDMQKFLQETQKSEMGKNSSFRIVWWIPTEFWRQTFSNTPNMTQEQKDNFCKVVDDYVVLCIVDGKITPFGGFVFTKRDEIVSNLSLAIGQGEKMKPLSDPDLSGDLVTLFAMMKPVLGRTLGQLGNGMEFICFKGVDSNGKRLLVPTENGAFAVELAGKVYKWRLPLGSLLPPRYDPNTGEEFPGNYEYSPFTGTKLDAKAPSK